MPLLQRQSTAWLAVLGRLPESMASLLADLKGEDFPNNRDWKRINRAWSISIGVKPENYTLNANLASSSSSSSNQKFASQSYSPTYYPQNQIFSSSSYQNFPAQRSFPNRSTQGYQPNYSYNQGNYQNDQPYYSSNNQSNYQQNYPAYSWPINTMQASGNRPPFSNPMYPNRLDFCFYHRQFGARAQKCKPLLDGKPCSWKGADARPNMCGYNTGDARPNMGGYNTGYARPNVGGYNTGGGNMQPR